MNAMQEEKIPKITEMLLAGGKMLRVHCGNCGSPLFEFQDKIKCPICGGIKKAPAARPNAEPKSFDNLERILHKKIEEMSSQLEKETDHVKILELLKSIRGTLETVEKLRR